MSPGIGTWRGTKRALFPIAAVVAVVAVSLFLWQSSGDKSGVTASPGGTEPPVATSPAKGLPVGPLQILGVEVLQPVADAGRVALDTAVQQEWLLRNTGATPITLGRTSIEVLEGC